ncbi:MAG: DNA polymerase IV [Candidatus Thorarchaeota archaeon]
MNRWIMHIDMDAFFASVEQYRNFPELVGQPVCVGHDPKKGLGRGVVRAASYEARAYGIHSGMPVSKAYRLCPDAIFVNGPFSNYTEASTEFMAVLHNFADGGRVRRASIDEAYIDVTFRSQDYEHPVKLAEVIQQSILNETRLPASIGIAPNMTVAKVATGMKKPNGITFVGSTPIEVADFLAPLKCRALNGIGAKTAERLSSYGIETLGHIQDLSITELWPIMGRGSSWIKQRATGIDERPIIDNGPRIRKSISKDRTFMNDIEPGAVSYVHEAIKSICSKISNKLHRKTLQFRTVTVKIRYGNYSTIQRSKSIPIGSQDESMLRKMALNIFDQSRNRASDIRLIGVKVSSLSESAQQAIISDYF